MSWDSVYTKLFSLLSDAITGLNSLLAQRGLATIQLWAKEELTKDVSPAGILIHESSSPSPLSSAQSPYYLDTFRIIIQLREPTASSGGRETKARKYLDALKDFLVGKRVENYPVLLGDGRIEFPDPTHTLVGIEIQIHHPGGEY